MQLLHLAEARYFCHVLSSRLKSIIYYWAPNADRFLSFSQRARNRVEEPTYAHALGVQSKKLQNDTSPTQRTQLTKNHRAHVVTRPAASIINIATCTDKNASCLTKKRHQNRVNMAARALLLSVVRGPVTHWGRLHGNEGHRGEIERPSKREKEEKRVIETAAAWLKERHTKRENRTEGAVTCEQERKLERVKN